MREIKFRGMNIIGDWYYGNLSILKEKIRRESIPTGSYISNSVGMPFAYHVRPETIGQFTGFKDCNGTEIYEGDTLIDIDVTLEENMKLEDTRQQVYWCEKEGCWKLDNTFHQNKKDGWYLGKDLKDFRFKVSGNIYENDIKELSK